jgi:hypothetical protein
LGVGKDKTIEFPAEWINVLKISNMNMNEIENHKDVISDILGNPLIYGEEESTPSEKPEFKPKYKISETTNKNPDVSSSIVKQEMPVNAPKISNLKPTDSRKLSLRLLPDFSHSKLNTKSLSKPISDLGFSVISPTSSNMPSPLTISSNPQTTVPPPKPVPPSDITVSDLDMDPQLLWGINNSFILMLFV